MNKQEQLAVTPLQDGYYRINNGKRILYWDGEKWMKPARDNAGKYYTWVSPLEKQPKVKSLEPVEIQKH
jgi:hypothetical protein